MDSLPSGGRTKPVHSLATIKHDAEDAFDSEDVSEQTTNVARPADAGGDETRESSTDSGTVNENRPANGAGQLNETNSIGSALSLGPDANPSDNNSAQYSMGSDTGDPKRTLINKYVKKVKSLMKK